MHQRISKKIFLYLFIFLSLVTVNNKKYSNDFYKIKYFNISGLNILETSKINEDLKDFKNNNIFMFDKKNISQKIYSNKFVEKLKIFKIYPSTLKIEIEKTKFLAIIKKNNTNYFIGTNGKLIEVKNEILNLPFVFGNINVDNFFKFKKIIDNSNFKFDEIKNFYYFKSNRWDVETKKKISLKLPSNLTVKKLNFISEIIEKNNFEMNVTLDFRQNETMVINE